MRRLPALLTGLSVALALCAALLVWGLNSTEYGAGGAQPPVIGGPFTLIDQNGQARTDRAFRGKWMLVYFGYTYCPDVCPTTLQDMAIALRKLGPKANQFVPLFITLDPARDHPAVLKKYLAAFGPEFEGLTGTPREIASVAHAYRVYFAKHPLPGGGYSVDHASTIYLMNPDGQFASTLDDQEGAATLERDLAARA
ncbi:MAG TPA: SCO family protein [Rhizomicrobium sp.]|nr:SCO family protein [Rhizomicrobium sp.]